MSAIFRVVIVAAVSAGLALYPQTSIAQQQPSQVCTPALPPGMFVLPGLHVQDHGDHVHLCGYFPSSPQTTRPAAPPAAGRPAAPNRPSGADPREIQDQIERARLNFQECQAERRRMLERMEGNQHVPDWSSGLAMNCQQWLTLIDQLQAQLGEAEREGAAMNPGGIVFRAARATTL